MKRKVIIGYKKNGVLNQARLTIDRDSINLMEVVEGDNIFLSIIAFLISMYNWYYSIKTAKKLRKIND